MYKNLFLFGFCCSLFFLSCRQASDNGKTVFRYNEQTGIATLDPAFAKNQSIIWAIHQLYNTLIETDSLLNLVPSLALRWDIDATKTTYTFHLRNDVFFHDNEAFANGKGRRMVAEDVVYSLKRVTDPATASSGAWIFNNRVDSVEAFKAIDDSTFQLKLARPFNPILGILSMQYCSIVPHEVVEKYGKDFRRHPCGTGPFMFKDWEEGLALTMLKNPTYFQLDTTRKRLPYLDAVKVSFLDSKAAEFLNFRQGKLDFINDIDPSFKDEILTKKGDLKKAWEGKVQLQKHAYLTTEYLGILFDSTSELVRNSPLRMRKVRQAINYAIDKQKMMLYLRNSIGFAATSGFSPRGLPSFDTAVSGYDYQPQKAKQLLAEAGFADGKNLPQIKLLTVPIYADLGSYIARQLGEAGIPVQVEVIQKSLLLEQTSKSQALFFRGSWQADYPDAENFFTVFYSKNPAPPNYTRYKNPAFDLLYEKALTETNDSLRYKMYNEMDRLIIADAPVVPLWYDMVIHLIQPNVSGFDANALNLLELRWAKK
ncbi:MAG: ABC transporter substrate-binding protein [Bacteroidota bacterium]